MLLKQRMINTSVSLLSLDKSEGGKSTMKKYLFTIFFLLISFHWLYAQEELAKVGTVGYQFLKIGMDARGESLGDAVAPMLDDSRAVFWNPVMLTKMQGWSVSFTHSTYLADMSMDGFSLAKNLPGIGTVGPVSNFAHLPDIVKWILSFLMLLGRLELFTVLIIFSPVYWKS